MTLSANIRDYGFIITATRVDGVVQTVFPVEALESRVTYDAACADGSATFVIENHAPKRRIARGCEIIAAEPLDPATVVVVGDQVFLHAYTEGVATTEGCE